MPDLIAHCIQGKDEDTHVHHLLLWHAKQKNRAGQTFGGAQLFHCARKPLLTHSQLMTCSILSSDSLDKKKATLLFFNLVSSFSMPPIEVKPHTGEVNSGRNLQAPPF